MQQLQPAIELTPDLSTTLRGNMRGRDFWFWCFGQRFGLSIYPDKWIQGTDVLSVTNLVTGRVDRCLFGVELPRCPGLVLTGIWVVPVNNMAAGTMFEPVDSYWLN